MRIIPGQDLFVSTDPLSWHAGLDVSGSPLSQVYDKENRQYEPNRAIVCTLITPWLEAIDTATDIIYSSKTTAETEKRKRLSWADNPRFYFRETKGNKAVYTALTSSQIRAKGDGSYELRYNVPVGESLTLVCRMNARDPRTNTVIYEERTLELSTTYMAAHNYKVELNVPEVLKINPIQYGEWKSSSQMGNYTAEHVLPVGIRASLYDGAIILRDPSESIENANANEQKVASIKVAYWWQWYDENTWRAFDADLPWLLTAHDASGNLPGDIKVNIEAIDKVRIRCFAKSYSAELPRPENPTDTGLFDETTIVRELPLTSGGKVIVDSGTFIDLVNTEPVKMHLEMFDNMGQIEVPDKYYKIEWYKKPHGYGTTETAIGSGQHITIDKEALGITRDRGVQVYPKVWDYGAFVPLTDGTAESPLGFTEPVYIANAKGEIVMARRIIG